MQLFDSRTLYWLGISAYKRLFSDIHTCALSFSVFWRLHNNSKSIGHRNNAHQYREANNTISHTSPEKECGTVSCLTFILNLILSEILIFSLMLVLFVVKLFKSASRSHQNQISHFLGTLSLHHSFMRWRRGEC